MEGNGGGETKMVGKSGLLTYVLDFLAVSGMICLSFRDGKKLKQFIPESWADLSKYCRYNFNEYFIEKLKKD